MIEKYSTKGQMISKANCQDVNSSKKRTNEFVFITIRRVFVRFLEEIEVTKKTFRNYLTFNKKATVPRCFLSVNSLKNFWSGRQVKFIYPEKATKFCEISTNYLTGSTQDK